MGPWSKSLSCSSTPEETSRKGGIVLPNLRCHVLAAKICDINNIMHKKDESLRTLFEKLWRNRQFTWTKNISKYTHLTSEKNTAFKLLYNCITDRDVLWNKGQQLHPLCYLCESEFESLSHLFENCEVVAPRQEKIGLKSLCQILTKPFSVEKIKSLVTILFGTFTENKEKTVFHLDQILQYGL